MGLRDEETLHHEQRAVGGRDLAVRTTVEYLYLGDLDDRALTFLDSALRAHDRPAAVHVANAPDKGMSGGRLCGGARAALGVPVPDEERDGGVLVMATLFGLYAFLLKLYADGGYQGPQFQGALLDVTRQVDVEIVKRSDAAKGFTQSTFGLFEPFSA